MQLVGVVEGKRTDQDTVDDAEDGGGAADPERKRGDDCCRESWRPPDRANRAAQISREVAEEMPGAFTGHSFHCQVQSSSPDAGRALRAVKADAAIDLPRTLMVEVILQFLVQLTLDRRRLHELANTMPESAEERHGCRASGLRVQNAPNREAGALPRRAIGVETFPS